MKFQLPLALRRALLAVLIPLAGVTSVSYAETDTPVAYENYTELLSFNDSDENWFDISAPSETTTMLLFSNNASIEFNNNTASPLLLDPSTSNGTRLQVQFIGNSGDISFINNTSRAVDGGAIGLFFENNSGEILFQNNSIVGGYGGAISARSGSEITFTDNSKISFVGNSAIIEEANRTIGGAIYTMGSVEFAGNSQVVFTDNTAYKAGGIWAAGITIVDTTEQVLFSGNQATGSSRYSSDTDGCGGAILLRYNNTYSLFNIANNAEVVFENNSAGVSGGAIYTQTANYCVPTFQNNTTLAFRNNTAGAKGGAVYGVEKLDFLENKYLYFENNTAEGEGGAIYSAGLLSITGNSTVAFTGNSSGTDGGAIYAPSLSITNNDTVKFRANYVKQYDEEGNLAGAVLNSIAGSSSLELSTSADYGASITFYDSVQVKYSYYHDLNTYEDSEGNTVTGTGTIAFSGLYAEEDLTAVFNELGLDTAGDTFRSCLETSLTSSFTGGTIILYGGTLSVSDNAILNILGTSGTTMAGNYTAKSRTTTKISNHGTLNIAKDATFDSAYAGLYIDNAAMTVGRNFTLSGISTLSGGTLDIAGTADLSAADDLEDWGGASHTAGRLFRRRGRQFHHWGVFRREVHWG